MQKKISQKGLSNNNSLQIYEALLYDFNIFPNFTHLEYLTAFKWTQQKKLHYTDWKTQFAVGGYDKFGIGYICYAQLLVPDMREIQQNIYNVRVIQKQYIKTGQKVKYLQKSKNSNLLASILQTNASIFIYDSQKKIQQQLNLDQNKQHKAAIVRWNQVNVNSLLSGGQNQYIYLWDIENKKCTNVFGHQNLNKYKINDFTWMNDQIFATISKNAIYIWDTRINHPNKYYQIYNPENNEHFKYFYSKQQRILNLSSYVMVTTFYQNSILTIWDTRKNQNITLKLNQDKSLERKATNITGLNKAGKQIITGHDNGSVLIFDEHQVEFQHYLSQSSIIEQIQSVNGTIGCIYKENCESQNEKSSKINIFSPILSASFNDKL